MWQGSDTPCSALVGKVSSLKVERKRFHKIEVALWAQFDKHLVAKIKV